MTIDTINTTFGRPESWMATDWGALEGVSQLRPCPVPPVQGLQACDGMPFSDIRRTGVQSVLAKEIMEILGDHLVGGRGGQTLPDQTGTNRFNERLLLAIGRSSAFLRINPEHVSYEMEPLQKQGGHFSNPQETIHDCEYIINKSSRLRVRGTHRQTLCCTKRRRRTL